VGALAVAAADPYPVGAVGWAQRLDQSLTGFVLQLFQCGGSDADGEAIGLRFQVARTFDHNAE